jgi:mono/diheme cytochrome c family protein
MRVLCLQLPILIFFSFSVQAQRSEPVLGSADSAKHLYLTGCVPCHKSNNDLYGPSLAYISRRRDRKWLYDFTRNNFKLMSSGDRYANCLYQQYNKTPMPLYPLTDRELNALYAYIDNESKRLGLAVPDDHLKKCVDSCQLYDTNRKTPGQLKNIRLIKPKSCDCKCGK